MGAVKEVQTALEQAVQEAKMAGMTWAQVQQTAMLAYTENREPETASR